jgi:tRNA modification GTPase
MFSTSDTIVAIATPPGRSGIGVVRLSGVGAARIAGVLLDRRGPLRPRVATFARIKSTNGAGNAHLDEVVATWFPRPKSYTGEDLVEIGAHGNPVILGAIVNAATSCGARLAQPGEFTLRAFLNGRLDLIQAEAVADLIQAATPLQARIAFDQLEGTLTGVIARIDQKLFDLCARFEASLDFPEEGYSFIDPAEGRAGLEAIRRELYELIRTSQAGRIIREGRQVAIVGKPNVGKSSLFNYLIGSERAIVTPIPGTTRDLVTETADVCGIRVRLVDTAGIRPTSDVVEVEGVDRAHRAADVADLTLVVLDRSRALEDVDRALMSRVPNGPIRLVINKVDLPAAWSLDDVHGGDTVAQISLKTGQGLEAMRSTIADGLNASELLSDGPVVTNLRHVQLLERAHAAIDRSVKALGENATLSEEFVLADVSEARHALEEITGTRTNDDLLTHIFSRFCIGK